MVGYNTMPPHSTFPWPDLEEEKAWRGSRLNEAKKNPQSSRA
jgi:hypothetical protein